jgi:hypothetical protein
MTYERSERATRDRLRNDRRGAPTRRVRAPVFGPERPVRQRPQTQARG